MNSPQETTYQSLAFHPHNILLTLVMMSISALFLAFSVAYIYARVDTAMPPIKIPLIFIFNTFILLASSATLIWAKRAYKNDQTLQYQQALIATLMFSLLFLVAQIWGWNTLFENNQHIASTTMAAYLWVISGLHFVHVLAGLPFLIKFLYTAYYRMKEPVSVLVYFSDPEKELKLRLLTRYWHYLDGLWIYLVLFFLLNTLF